MKTKREQCPNCSGYGLVTNSYTGEPDDCPECGLSGIVIIAVRDKRGRFVPEKRRTSK